MAFRMPSPWKHPKTGTYYFRERVPTDLTGPLRGKKLILTVDGTASQITFGEHAKVSLRTKDAEPARVRYRDVSAQIDRRYHAERNGGADLTHLQVMQLAGEWYRSTVGAFEGEPGDAEGWLVMTDRRAEALARLDPPSAEDEKFWPDRFNPDVGERLLEGTIPLDAFLDERGLKLTAGSRLRLLQEIARADMAAAARLADNAVGDYGPDEHGRRFPQTAFKGPTKGPATADIWTLFDAWAAEKQPRAATKAAYRANIAEFVAFRGHSDAARITPANVVAWKDKLVERGSPTKTINGYKLAALNAVLNLAVRNHRIPTNPAAGVRASRTAKAGERMKGYTDEEARTILQAALSEARPALRWIPWLCAMTGARVAEVCQLRGQDVREVEGVWTVHFTADAGPLKNATSERAIPLHPCLIDRGFVQFVKEKGAGYLFFNADRRRPGALAKPGKSLANHLREWIKGLAGLQVGMDHRKAPNHAWRHRFAGLARKHLIDSEKREAILGHRLPGEQGTYGDMTGLFAEIKKLPDPLTGTAAQ
jgi:integrase